MALREEQVALRGTPARWRTPDGDYYGLTVIIAARIAAQAGRGQVLVDEAAARDGEADGVRYEEFGPVRLKGVAHPAKIYRALRHRDPGVVAAEAAPSVEPGRARPEDRAEPAT